MGHQWQTQAKSSLPKISVDVMACSLHLQNGRLPVFLSQTLFISMRRSLDRYYVYLGLYGSKSGA